MPRKKRRKKSLIGRVLKLLIFCSILVGLYFGAMIGLGKLAEKAIPVAVSYADAAGIAVTDLQYGKVSVSLINGVSIENLSAYVQREDGDTEQEVFLKAEKVGAKLASPLNISEVIVFAKNADVSPQKGRVGKKIYANEKLPTIKVNSFEVLQAAGIGDIKTLVNGLVEQMKSIAKDASNSEAFDLDAEVTVPMEKGSVKVNTLVKLVNQRYEIQLDKAGVKAISKQFEEPLTDAEVMVVAENPLRAPRLLSIKSYAEQTAKDMNKKDSRVPEDAYRHVLWSYLLTKAYGAEFAEEVTDAHEIGATDNTELDHEMDYNNNRLGRKYANAGKSESQLKLYVLKDADIIPAPGKYRRRKRKIN